jgi:hypothetical protein
VLLGGLLWAARTALRTPAPIGARPVLPKHRVVQSLPVIGFCAALTLGMLGLLIA